MQKFEVEGYHIPPRPTAPIFNTFENFSQVYLTPFEPIYILLRKSDSYFCVAWECVSEVSLWGAGALNN